MRGGSGQGPRVDSWSRSGARSDENSEDDPAVLTEVEGVLMEIALQMRLMGTCQIQKFQNHEENSGVWLVCRIRILKYKISEFV